MLKKVLLFLIFGLIAVDALLLHGRYRERVAQEAAMAEYKVESQDWSTPLVDNED